MALVKMSGPVSNYREETQIKSANTTTGAWGMGRTTFRTQKVISFRLGKKPVVMKIQGGGVDLTDGDDATVVGTDGGSGMKAILIRNDGTGIAYSISMLYWLLWGIPLSVGGLALLATELALVSFLLTPVGAFMLYKGFQLKQAQDLLASGIG